MTCAVPFGPVRSGCVCVAAAAFCSPPPAFEDVLFPSRSSLEAAAASTVASLMHAHARSGVSKCAVSSVDSLARPQPRTLCTFTQRRDTMRRDCGSTLAGPRFFTSRTAPEAPACDDGTAKSSNSGSQLAPTRSIWARLRAVHWTSSATLAGRVWSRRTTDALWYVINAITAANGMRPVCSALLGTSRFYISPSPVATTHRPISTSFVHCTAHIDFMPDGEQRIWSGSRGRGRGGGIKQVLDLTSPVLSIVSAVFSASAFAPSAIHLAIRPLFFFHLSVAFSSPCHFARSHIRIARHLRRVAYNKTSVLCPCLCSVRPRRARTSWMSHATFLPPTLLLSPPPPRPFLCSFPFLRLEVLRPFV